MTQCNTKTRLNFQSKFPIDIKFSADDISSDGGVILLRQAEEQLGVCETIAQMIPDHRNQDKIIHSRHEQVMQRILQIAMGYEDQNDANWLRNDPVFKAACDLDVDENALSSQPTLSRFENAVTQIDVTKMQWMLVFTWLNSLDDDRREITIDVDSSAFEGHGEQQQLSFCNFFGGHKLHPLLLFDGETGQLITVILRPGKAHDAAGINDWIPNLITLLKTGHREDCSIVVRADGGFATPRFYRALEELDNIWGQVAYLIGFRQNSVVNEVLEPSMEIARQRHHWTGQKARIFVDFEYQATSWKKKRAIIGKAEVTEKGDNPRYVVTNFKNLAPRLAYEVGYCGRGRCEQWIGEYKNSLFGDRISCHRFEANGFRLILHALVFRLMFHVRSQLCWQAQKEETPQPIAEKCRRLARATFATLRLRLLKVAFVVRRSARRLYLQGAQSFPMADVFHHVARAMR